MSVSFGPPRKVHGESVADLCLVALMGLSDWEGHRVRFDYLNTGESFARQTMVSSVDEFVKTFQSSGERLVQDFRTDYNDLFRGFDGSLLEYCGRYETSRDTRFMWIVIPQTPHNLSVYESIWDAYDIFRGAE